MSDATLTTLQSYMSALGHGEAKKVMSSSPQQASTTSDVGFPAEHLLSPPLPQEVEEKSETRSEPTMPAQKLPRPPDAMGSPRVVEDPFAEMLSNEGDQTDVVLPTAEEQADSSPSTMCQSSIIHEDKTQDGFDAFPPVGEPFESDPFSVNGFGGTRLDEGAVDDPFTATDAVFAGATAAASDGFDAFPSSEAHYDAFGQ